MSIPELRANTDGVFYAYWSDSRRSKRKSMGTANIAVAKERFAHWLLLGGTERSQDVSYTVEDCWTVYWKKHVEVNVTGVETLAHGWKALKPHFGALAVSQVTQDEADKYTKKRMSGQLGRKVTSSTVRRELAYLAAALAFCAAPPQRMFAHSQIEKIKLPAAGEARDRWLTTAEIQRMLAAAERLRRGNRLSRGERFLWLALATAGRMSAILDLTWDRVDFETLVVHLDVPGRVKTKKRRASVPISDDLAVVLRRAYVERNSDLVMDNKADVWSTIQLIAIEAGFGGKRPAVLRTEKPKATGVSPHVLRHTAATHMARKGVPLWKIAKVLGNTMTMVEKVYSHHCPDDLREAVNMVSNGFSVAA